VFPPFPLFLCKFSVDFPAKYQDWAATDPADLFQAPIHKAEANPKVKLALVIYLQFLYEFKCQS
jgi:DNA topoisomerase-3